MPRNAARFSSVANSRGSKKPSGPVTPAAMSSGSTPAALTTTSLVNFLNLALDSGSNFANSSLAWALNETSRVAANFVRTYLANGLGGTPCFCNFSSMALTDIAGVPGREQDMLTGAAAKAEKAPLLLPRITFDASLAPNMSTAGSMVPLRATDTG